MHVQTPFICVRILVSARPPKVRKETSWIDSQMCWISIVALSFFWTTPPKRLKRILHCCLYQGKYDILKNENTKTQVVFFPLNFSMVCSLESPHGGARPLQVPRHKMEYITSSHMQQRLITAQCSSSRWGQNKKTRPVLAVSHANRFQPATDTARCQSPRRCQ